MTTKMIPIDKIALDPNNARKRFRGIESLASNIELNGLLQNLVVRHGDNGHYVITAGSRRLKALQRLNAKAEKAEAPRPYATVLCKVEAKKLTHEQALVKNAAENTAREDLAPWELGARYLELTRSGMTHKEVGLAVGRTGGHVSQCIGVVKNIAPDILDQLINGDTQITTRLAIRLAALKNKDGEPDHNAQRRLLVKELHPAKKKKKRGRRANPEASANSASPEQRDDAFSRASKVARFLSVDPPGSMALAEKHGVLCVRAVVAYILGETKTIETITIPPARPGHVIKTIDWSDVEVSSEDSAT